MAGSQANANTLIRKRIFFLKDFTLAKFCQPEQSSSFQPLSFVNGLVVQVSDFGQGGPDKFVGLRIAAAGVAFETH